MDRGREDVKPMLMRIDQAAQALGIGRTTMYRLIKEGHFTVVRIGRATRLRLADVQAWVDQEGPK